MSLLKISCTRVNCRRLNCVFMSKRINLCKHNETAGIPKETGCCKIPTFASDFILLFNTCMRQYSLLLAIIMLFPLFLLAQSRNAGTIAGKIFDNSNRVPVEYANVVLMDSASRKMVSGAVSDSSGNFRLEKVSFGTYYIEYSFIGYEKQRSKMFSVNRKKLNVNLGMLDLTPSAINMKEVNITGEKNMMISRIDRKIFNVQKDILAQTGTVTDILQTIPSVSVDMDGNVSLRGSGNVTILINGRPSVMGTSANLEQMPASMIEKIEVITNPSAKYKPDGTAGIINIILKKERKAGFNGSLSANAGNSDRYNATVQLNRNTGKLNLFGSYGFRQDFRMRTSDLKSQTIDTAKQSVYLDQNSEGSARNLSHLLRLGLDWTPDASNAAGVSGTYNFRQVKRTDVADNLYRNDSMSPYDDFTRSMSGKETENSLGLNSYYEHIFDKESDSKLRADFEYQRDSETEDDNYTTIYTLPALPDANDQTHRVNSTQEYNLAATYNRPLWENSELEVGYEGNIAISDQNQQVQHFDPDSARWITDPEQANVFSSNQTVHALFTTVACQFGIFSVMGGLRAEEALVALDFISLDTNTRTSYFALYPTLHLALSSGKNEWQLNYSRRVNRPDGEDMNPVPEYRDPRNIFVGNPNLKPEDIHSIELGYSLKTDNLTLVPTLFYRRKVNGFTMVTYNRIDSVLVTTIDNLAKDQSAGIDFSGSWRPVKILNLNFSSSGFYSEIDASNIGYSANKSTFSWNVKLNASLNITRTTIFQFNGQYRSEMLTAQGMRSPSWVVNLGFRQDLWKKKISIVATVSDLFKSQKMINRINTPELVQETTRQRDGRVIYCGFVFNFGSTGKKEKESKFEFDNGMDR